MVINKKIIDDALSFYEIKDDDYRLKCYEAYDFLISNQKAYKKFLKLYEILYIKKDYSLAKLWKIKDKNEFFGGIYHPYLTNLLLLLGYNIHFNNIKKYKIGDDQIKLHKQRVKETLTYDVYERRYEGIRVSQMLWGSYFVTLRIIEVGRLQYELSLFNPATNKKEKVIRIHIPRGGKLDNKSVLSSLKKSKSKIEYYFNVKNPKYYCESWLLSKEIRKFVKDDSNIAKFYDLFDITKEKNGINDVLNFVFRVIKCDDYKTLQESTSLQRKIKRVLLKGDIINIGIGELKEDIL